MVPPSSGSDPATGAMGMRKRSQTRSVNDTGAAEGGQTGSAGDAHEPKPPIFGRMRQNAKATRRNVRGSVDKPIVRPAGGL
jgi:hypothetical protein